MNVITRTIVVAKDHPSLPGHFPDRPIVPGVVLLDSILTEVLASFPPGTRLVAIPTVKFRRPVEPDEVVTVRIDVTDRSHTASVQFAATVDDALVAEGAFALSIAPLVEL